MFIKDIEELKNKQSTMNNAITKCTGRNQQQSNWGRKMDKWAGRENDWNNCNRTWYENLNNEKRIQNNDSKNDQKPWKQNGENARINLKRPRRIKEWT